MSDTTGKLGVDPEKWAEAFDRRMGAAGGALAAATGVAEGGSELKGGGQTNLYPARTDEEIEQHAALMRHERAQHEAVVKQHAGHPDYTTMSGAEFQRAVGVDPVKWAAAFLQSYARADGVRTDGHRELYVAGWFHDAMEAASENARTTYSAAHDYR